MDPEFDDVVAPEDLMALERRFAEERRGGAVSRRCQFEYGWALVRSRYRSDVQRGVALLGELLPEGTREEQRDYSFYLALGNYRLKMGCWAPPLWGAWPWAWPACWDWPFPAPATDVTAPPPPTHCPQWILKPPPPLPHLPGVSRGDDATMTSRRHQPRPQCLGDPPSVPSPPHCK
ncbi:mitochondrial fission 1 protein isoform X1 [Patagioenas fasciata]|uniref:mitochondrial fission 1 protein isoform X1 n=1 Tax=Patagioenas fasciata TaxID=372321 RepID=UPI003A9A5B8A